jgi:acyl-CoA thioesterase
MGFEFDDDTRATRAEGGWTLDITPRWNIGANPNGGYILAAMVRPILDDLDKPDPLTISAHYLRPTSIGAADLRVDVFRKGRMHTHVQASLIQDTERVRLLAAFGDLANVSGPTLVRSSPPALPPPEECLGRDKPPPFMAGTPEMMRRFETRFAPDTAWLRGERSDVTSVTGWVRFADGRPADVASLPLFADAFPPAVFAIGPTGWVPTIELTVHVRARPAPGWLRARFETRFLVNGYLEEDGELWDADDNLVAQSRQLALLLPPPAAPPAG